MSLTLFARTCRGIWGQKIKLFSVVDANLRGVRQPIITGRNEVLAKVIFLHLSVIHSVHRGGVPDQAPPRDQVPPPTRFTPWDQIHTHNPPRPHPAGTRYTPRDQVHPPRTTHTPLDQVPPAPGPGTHPPEQQPPEYGQWSAGTHPTGMHSCLAFYFAKSCMKMKQFRPRFGRGHVPSSLPIGPATLSDTRICVYEQNFSERS